MREEAELARFTYTERWDIKQVEDLLGSDSLSKHDRRIFADVKGTASYDGLLNVVYRHAIGHGFGRIHALGKRG